MGSRILQFFSAEIVPEKEKIRGNPAEFFEQYFTEEFVK